MTQALTSIRTCEGTLEIVNQLLLPHNIEYIKIDSVEAAYDAIKTMKVSTVLPPFTMPLLLLCRNSYRSEALQPSHLSLPCRSLSI